MPKTQNAVKKIVRKEVKKAERKQHGKQTRKQVRKSANRGARKVLYKTPKSLQNRLATLALGDTAERAAAVQLAKALCAPNMFASFGVQDGYSSMPTASSSPFMCQPAAPRSDAAGTTDGNGIPSDESCAIATRDPRCALRYYSGAGCTYSYNVVDQEEGETRDLEALEELHFMCAWVDTGSTTTQVHSDTLYAGAKKEGPAAGEPLLLGQANQTITANGYASDASTKVSIWVLEGDQYNQYVCTKVTSGLTFTAAFNEFHRANDATYALNRPFFHWGKFSSSRAITDGQLAFHGSNIPTLCQLALAGWGDVADIVDRIRVCSLNLMYSNTSPVVSKQGFAVGWQVPSDKDPFDIFTRGFEYLANQPQAERMIADDGIHGFWKSTDAVDWEYLEVGYEGGQTGYYEIDSDSDYLMIMTKIPGSEGRAGYWTVFTDVQYRHDSVWFPTEYPTHDRKTFELALEIQSRVPQWHCNPFHIKDIFKWIGQHKNQIQQSVSMGAELMGPRAAGYGNIANKFLDVWFK